MEPGFSLKQGRWITFIFLLQVSNNICKNGVKEDNEKYDEKDTKIAVVLDSEINKFVNGD